MVIKCTLSVPPESVGFYVGKSWGNIPLPDYMTKMGPYVIDHQKKEIQIITIYEFGQSKFTEAYEYISEQLEAFRLIPGFTLSVFILDKGREFKWYQISLNQGDPTAGVTPISRSFPSFPIFAGG